MIILLLILTLLLPVSVQAAGVLTPAANPPVPITVLLQSGIAFIKASSGSIADNCAITAMTALPRTFSGGAYLYLPANAISAGSAAGWYWFVASSTTAGTCYNNTYTSGTPRVPASNTAFATTGPGAYTGDTGTITGPTVTMLANSMGINGRLAAYYGSSHNVTAGNKILVLNYGGTACNTTTTTTHTGLQVYCDVTNRGVVNRQVIEAQLSAGSVSNGSVSAAEGTVDTSQNVTVAFTVNTAAATDHLILETYSIQIIRGD